MTRTRAGALSVKAKATWRCGQAACEHRARARGERELREAHRTAAGAAFATVRGGGAGDDRGAVRRGVRTCAARPGTVPAGAHFARGEASPAVAFRARFARRGFFIERAFGLFAFFGFRCRFFFGFQFGGRFRFGFLFGFFGVFCFDGLPFRFGEGHQRPDPMGVPTPAGRSGPALQISTPFPQSNANRSENGFIEPSQVVWVMGSSL